MPAEEGFPATDVAVRSVDTFDLVAQGFSQKGIQIVEVPALARSVHQ